MIRTPLLLPVIAALLGCGCQAPAPVDPPVPDRQDAWPLALELIGDWVDSTSSDTFTVVETWVQVDDSTLSGVGRVLAGADTVFIEGLKLSRTSSGLVYSALPGGEANGTFTHFACTHTTADTLVFTDPANDFPKRIRYLRDGQGWHAIIDENRDGPQREEHFRFLPR